MKLIVAFRNVANASKSARLVYTTISNALPDLRFSQNQPLALDEDKNINLEVREYISAVGNSVTLQLYL